MWCKNCMSFYCTCGKERNIYKTHTLNLPKEDFFKPYPPEDISQTSKRRTKASINSLCVFDNSYQISNENSGF